MWPQPRVGQRVKLRNGHTCEVYTVRSAKDILKSKTEAQALVMIAEVQASFGQHWTEVYYEADVYWRGRIITVDTRQVAEVIDPL